LHVQAVLSLLALPLALHALQAAAPAPLKVLPVHGVHDAEPPPLANPALHGVQVRSLVGPPPDAP
jgi:hypothetical protein